MLRNWLIGAAGRKLREQSAEAMHDHLAETTDSPPAPGPCDVGVVFALGIESGGLEDLLQQTTTFKGDRLVACRGELAGASVVALRSGAGAEAAARGTEALIHGHHPAWVISAGLAGGLVSDLAAGDLLMVDSLVNTAGKHLDLDLKVDPDWLAATPNVHAGRLLSADRLVRLPDEKKKLGHQHKAMAVDMETFAVAETCRRQKVRFMAVRIVHDTVEEELPADIEQLLRQKTTSARLGAAAAAIWRRPGSVKDMWRLRENALVASDRLAEFLAGMIGQLVPGESE